jgi:hypothetical protein
VSLLIPDSSKFVQSATLAIAVNADPVPPPFRRINEDLCLPTTIGSPTDATLPIRVPIADWTLTWRTVLAGVLVPRGITILSIPSPQFGGKHPNTTAQAVVFSVELALSR